MKTRGRQHPSLPARSREIVELRARVADMEETIRAIRTGEVDAVVIAGKHGLQVFTLEGAEHAYRRLIESMNEGALTVTADSMILYANRCFARMVKCRLEQVIGSSFRRFLFAADRATLRPLMKRHAKSGSKVQVLLKAADGSPMPVQVSMRPVAKVGSNRATIGMVVTDATEARRNEETLRALTQRVVHLQEAERARLALELQDNITQQLCAVLARWQALVNTLAPLETASRGEARKLSEMLGRTVEEAQRIGRNLRPSVLDEPGLVPALRATCTEFADRTGVSIKLAFVRLTARLPTDTELTLYRILQEALSNVEEHARARHVTVSLRRQGAFVHLAIHDDGIGFDPDRQFAGRNRKGGLGLISMRERAAFVGGTFEVRASRRAGTEIEVRIPVKPIGEKSRA